MSGTRREAEMTVNLAPSQIRLLESLSLGDRPLTPEDWDSIAEDLQVLVDLRLVSTNCSGGIEVEKTAAYVLQDFERGAFIETGGTLMFHI